MIDKAPDAFRTISEAAEDLGLPQHVLRFWETRFTQIKPLKRGGGRRYYRPDDLEFLRGLKHLLHAERYTIKGVQKIIKEQGIKAVQTAFKTDGSAVSTVKPPVADQPSPAQEPRTRAAFEKPSSAPALRLQDQLVANAPARVKLEAALAELLDCRQVLVNSQAA